MKEPHILEISEKKLVGMQVRMSYSDDKTSLLWRNFKPRVGEIAHNLKRRLHSVQIFDQDFRFENFTSTTELDKWAAVEVEDFNNLPDKMETLILSGGKYAVFAHRGAADSFHQIFQFIFGVWMPNSQYKLDQREHFEILGDNYNPFDPNAEEEIWIPINPNYALV